MHSVTTIHGDNAHKDNDRFFLYVDLPLYDLVWPRNYHYLLSSKEDRRPQPCF